MSDLAALWAEITWPLCWIVAVVAALCWSATRSVTRLSAAQRHLVWTVGMVVMLAMPVLGLGAAAWRSRADTWSGPQVLGPAQSAAARLIHLEGDAHAEAVRVVGTARDRSAAPSALFVVWLAGAAVTAFVFVLGHVGVGRLVLRAGDLHGRVGRQAEALARELGPGDHVRFRAGEPGQVPLTWGWPRSVVVLPAGCEEWAPDRLRAVLLHELAHVARGDLLTQAAAHLACVLFWFHPAVWFMAGLLRLEQEQSCDDRVLAHGSAAADYAAHLVGVTRHLHAARDLAPAGLALGGRDQLRRRIDALLEDRRSRRDPGARGVTLAVVAGLAVASILAVGGLGAVAGEPVGNRELTAVPTAVDTIMVQVPGRGPTRVLVLDDGRPLPHVDVLPHAEEAARIRPSP